MEVWRRGEVSAGDIGGHPSLDGDYNKPSAEVGGAMLAPESITSPTAEKKFIGSAMIMEAESLEKMTEIIHSDIYYTSGVVCALFFAAAHGISDNLLTLVGSGEIGYSSFLASR